MELKRKVCHLDFIFYYFTFVSFLQSVVLFSHFKGSYLQKTGSSTYRHLHGVFFFLSFLNVIA